MRIESSKRLRNPALLLCECASEVLGVGGSETGPSTKKREAFWWMMYVRTGTEGWWSTARR
ncbi:hypothetical protein V8C44DRAFT_322656 [Trichoderma aethiopicum]